MRKNYFKAVGILVLTFILLASTGFVVMAGAVTAGLGLYSVAKQSMGTGLAFTTVIPEIPDFTVKTPDEVKDLDDDELLAYKKAEKEFDVATMRSEYLTAIKDLEADGADPKALKTITTRLEEISKEHVKWGQELDALKEAKDKTVMTYGAALGKFLVENTDKLKEIKAAGQGHITFKVPETIETTNASNPDGIPELVGVQMAPPTNVNLKQSIVEGLVTTFQTTLAAYPYTESVPKDGDFTFVLETGTKPQIDFDIETRYAEPVKVAAYEVLSDESIQDIPGLQSIATDYLRKKHDLKKQNGILFGDGLGANPRGATDYGRLFVPGAMLNTVTDSNFMDVVNACITDVYTTHNFTDEVPYMPNLVMINPVDYFVQLVSAKDGNGLPLFPTASLFNTVTIGGVTIIPFEDIPTGQIFCADMSKYNITNYIDYTIRIGFINDQLITNEFTIVGESRFHAFVKKLDEQAFIFDSISDIQEDIDPALP